PGHLDFLEATLLRAFPEHGLSERRQIFQARGQGDEMIAGELAHLAGEVDAAIGQKDFGLADAAGIEDDLAGRGIAGVVLVRDAEIEIAERHPDPLAAPAHMDGLALERHGLAKGRAGFWRQLFLETGLEGEVAGADNELAHSGDLVMGWEGAVLTKQICSGRFQMQGAIELAARPPQSLRLPLLSPREAAGREPAPDLIRGRGWGVVRQ